MRNGDASRRGFQARTATGAAAAQTIGCLWMRLWVLRTGSLWRDLPEEFGNWNSVFQRFRRWAIKGVWESLFKALVEDQI